MADRVQARGIDDDEGGGLLRMVRRGIGSVVTWHLFGTRPGTAVCYVHAAHPGKALAAIG